MKRLHSGPEGAVPGAGPRETGFDMSALGARFKSAREERSLTMRAVAERAGYSVTHISQIERGATCPTVGALARIAAALGHDAKYFLETEPKPEFRHTPRAQARELEPRQDDSVVRLIYVSDGISGGRLQMLRAVVQPHATRDQSIAIWVPAMLLGYVTRGRMVLLWEDQEFAYAAGDAMTIQPGIRYRVYNPGPEDLEMIGLIRNEQVRWIPGRGELVSRALLEQQGPGGAALE